VANCPYPEIRLADYVTFERLEISCQGSGCTLASAIAARIAHGLEPVAAILQTQNYSFEALNNARKLGKGQFLPRRLYWARGLRSAA
jgi:hydroxymethylpyrimidine/phosphomethylpyrimidine kinase